MLFYFNSTLCSFEGGDVKEEQQQQVSHLPHQSHQQQLDTHHHHQQQFVQLDAREAPGNPEGGDSSEVSISTQGRCASSHMLHSTMHRYGTETLSSTTTDIHHHQQQQHHHLSEVHQHAVLQSAHRHLDDSQQHLHQEADDDVDRNVSSITAAMRGARGDYLGNKDYINLLSESTRFFANLTSSNAASNNGGSNHHHHVPHHLEDVLSEESYLQHQIRTSGGSPSVRTVGNGSPTSSHSPHDEQGLSSPHRQAQEAGYSPSDQGRLQSFTHLTAMQPPPPVQTNHGLQESDRGVSDPIYMDSIYTHHATTAAATPHHHQDQHDQGASAPHSPSGPLSRLVIVYRCYHRRVSRRPWCV